MFQSVEGLSVKVAAYVFHDQPMEGQRLLRATTAAYLTETGELFIGCSCASESDQFTRLEGRENAQAEAYSKLQKWLRKSPKAKPDDLILVDGYGCNENGVHVRENKAVRDACLRFELERFRLILRDRYDIILRLNEELSKVSATV